MIKLIQNFNKSDCRHFKWVFSRACCGRGTVKTGACQIPTKEGTTANKVCSLKMSYCRYQKREEN